MYLGARSRGAGRSRAGGTLETAVRVLFSGGEQGFYFDPLDPATAYQDAAGTTAGVVAQPVGLALDKSKGAVRGAELVTNGGFDSAASWTPGITGTGSATIAGGVATITRVDATNKGSFSQNIVLEAAKWYEVTGVCAGGTTFVSLGGAGANFAPGPVRFIFRAAASGASSLVLEATNNASTVSVDNMSTREIPGNHSTQSTSPSRPVWAQDASGFYRDTFDGFDDSLTIAAGGGSTTGFFYCAAINVIGGAGTARTIISDAGTNTGYRLRINATNQLELAAGNGVSFTSVATVATLSVGSTYVVTAWDDGVNLNVQVNQGAVASVARPAVSAGTSTMTEGKDNGAASSFANAGLYSRVYRAGTVPDATQRAQLQRFNASRAGATL